MPTLMASAPASTSAFAASAVATLPAMTCAELESVFTRSTARATSRVVAVGGIDDDAIASGVDQCLDRAKPASPTVVAAATRRRPSASFVACGAATDFSISLTVIRPTQ